MKPVIAADVVVAVAASGATENSVGKMLDSPNLKKENDRFLAIFS